MNSTRESLTSVGLLLLRVGIGCLMLVHGVAKLQGFSQLSESFADPIGLGSKFSLILAIGAEVGCSLLLIVGARGHGEGRYRRGLHRLPHPYQT
jgi:putative oxidoreductase